MELRPLAILRMFRRMVRPANYVGSSLGGRVADDRRGIGTTRTFRDVRSMSAIEGNSDIQWTAPGPADARVQMADWPRIGAAK